MTKNVDGAVILTGNAINRYAAMVTKHCLIACTQGYRLNSVPPTRLLQAATGHTGKSYGRPGKAAYAAAIADLQAMLAA